MLLVPDSFFYPDETPARRHANRSPSDSAWASVNLLKKWVYITMPRAISPVKVGGTYVCTNVRDGLKRIRETLTQLVQLRARRKDGFVQMMRKAVESRLGDDVDVVMKMLTKSGINRSLAKEALKIAEQKGRFTIFALVDALTRLAGQLTYAGDRIEADRNAASLLALAA